MALLKSIDKYYIYKELCNIIYLYKKLQINLINHKTFIVSFVLMSKLLINNGNKNKHEERTYLF